MNKAYPKTARFRSAALLVALNLFVLAVYGQSPAATSDQTALDRYIAQHDPSNKYE